MKLEPKKSSCTRVLTSAENLKRIEEKERKKEELRGKERRNLEREERKREREREKEAKKRANTIKSKFYI